jgi:DNA-binding transcriptional regulator YdaS (Cro superfamily)
MDRFAISTGVDSSSTSQVNRTRQDAAVERASRIMAAEEQIQSESLSPADAAEHQSFYTPHGIN